MNRNRTRYGLIGLAMLALAAQLLVACDRATPTPSPTPTEEPATLLVNKLVDKEQAALGETLKYTLVVMNDQLGGADPGTRVELRDTLPATLELLPDSLSEGAEYQAESRTIVWTGQVPRGLSVEVSFQATVMPAAAGQWSVVNTVGVVDAFGRSTQRSAQTQVTQPEPTATPAAAGPWHPAGTRTGMADIDRIIDAILVGDLAAKEALVRYITTPCTTMMGLGGPPKCQAGEADGTPVEVFPVLAGEGSHLRRDTIVRALDFAVKGLYAVYRVPADAYQEEYWPAGDYGIVFVGEREGVTVVVHAAGGSLVRLDFQFWPSDILVARDAGELVLPPPGWRGTGTLEGHVTIGPLVPVVQEGTPEPTPWPEVWYTRWIVIYAEDGQTEVTYTNIDAQGNYRVSLQAGTYVIDINHEGLDRAAGLPQKVELVGGQVTRLDVAIDTGLR